MIYRVAVVDIVIIAKHRIDITRSVNAHIHELMPIGDGRVGIIIDHVIGEGLPAISRNSHPNHMITAGASLAACDLASICNTTKGLIDDVILWVDDKISRRIILSQPEMI